MLEKISSNWWMFALRGLFAVAFGIVAMIWPEQTSLALVLVFGAFALVDGLLTAFAGISAAPYFERWWALLVEGAAGIIIGLTAISLPDLTGRAVMYFIAVWALVTGIFEIVAAFQLRRVITGEWMMVLGGLLSIVFGILLFVFPGAGAVSLVGLIGIYAIVFGILETIFAFRLLGLRHDFKATVESGI